MGLFTSYLGGVSTSTSKNPKGKLSLLLKEPFILFEFRFNISINFELKKSLFFI